MNSEFFSSLDRYCTAEGVLLLTCYLHSVFDRFVSNKWLGALVFSGIVAGKLVA